jgi:hypothetical protein
MILCNSAFVLNVILMLKVQLLIDCLFISASPQESQNGVIGISVIFTDCVTDNHTLTSSPVTSSPVLCGDIRHHLDIDNNNIKLNRDPCSFQESDDNSYKRHRHRQKRGKNIRYDNFCPL